MTDPQEHTNRVSGLRSLYGFLRDIELRGWAGAALAVAAIGVSATLIYKHETAVEAPRDVLRAGLNSASGGRLAAMSRIDEHSVMAYYDCGEQTVAQWLVIVQKDDFWIAAPLEAGVKRAIHIPLPHTRDYGTVEDVGEAPEIFACP